MRIAVVVTQVLIAVVLTASVMPLLMVTVPAVQEPSTGAALAIAMLLGSYFAARQFSVGQNSWPLLPTLSVVFIASVCGLVDRGAQLTILDQV